MAFSNIDLNQKLCDCAKSGDHLGVAGLLFLGADARAHSSKALCEAAGNGHHECVKLLIPASNPNDNDSVALRWAACNGYAECVKLLIPVACLNSNSKALGIAVRFGRAECVKLLIPVSDPNDIHQNFQDAIDYRNIECATLLVPAKGPLLNRKKSLAFAILHGSADLVSLMLACDPLIFAGRNTPLLRDAALANGHADLALLLSSIIEQETLLADLPPAARRDAPPRL